MQIRQDVSILSCQMRRKIVIKMILDGHTKS